MKSLKELLDIYKPEVIINSVEKHEFEGVLRDSLGFDIPIDGSFDVHANFDEGYTENIEVFKKGTEIKFDGKICELVGEELDSWIDFDHEAQENAIDRACHLYDQMKGEGY